MPNPVPWCRNLNSPVRNAEKSRTEFQEILAKPIRELGLKLEGSPVEQFVQQLYRELEAKGIHKFRPLCYLTDEWGCPSGEPVIGIPFYLANPDLAQLEREMNDNAWASMPVDPRVVFELPFEERWAGAWRLLGIDIDRLSTEAGHA